MASHPQPTATPGVGTGSVSVPVTHPAGAEAPVHEPAQQPVHTLSSTTEDRTPNAHEHGETQETALPAMREASSASGREYDSDSVGAPSAFSIDLSVCLPGLSSRLA